MSVKRSLAWLGSAQMASLALQFGSTVVLARYLTLHEAGIYAVALAVVGVLSLIQALGLQALIVREPVLTPTISSTTFTINALISIALAAAIAGASYGGGAYLRDAGVGRALLVLAVTPLFGIFAFLPAAIMEREGRFKQIALIGTVGTICGTITTIALAIDGFTYMSVAYAQWVQGAVIALLMNIVGRRHARYRLSFKAWRRVGDFGLQMLAITGINSLATRLSDVILGRVLGLSALGLFNRATSLNGMIWTNVHLLIGRVMLVDFADLHRRGVPLRARYLNTVEVVTAILWPLFGGLAVLAEPFILHVYGPNWVPAAKPLVLIVIASMMNVAITMTWELFAATGQLRIQTRIEFIRAIVALAAFVGGCMISLEAAAAARVVDGIFAFFLYRPHLDRMTGTALPDFWPIYARSLLLTLLACLPSAALLALYRTDADVPLPLLGASIGAGILLWAGGLVLVRHPLVGEVRRMVEARLAA